MYTNLAKSICRACLAFAILSSFFCVNVLVAEEDTSLQIDSQTLQFFESEIRPLLAAHCFECHSARSEKLKGGLRLDHVEGIMEGGDSGPAAIPGKPAESAIMEAVRWEGLEMPPDRRLSDTEIAKLDKWIRLGIPFPDGDTSSRPPEQEFEITDEDRAYWAYQPISSPQLPSVAEEAWNEHPIDRLIYSKLQQNGLQPNRPADPRHLVRRLYFNLIGLPPSPEQVDLFVRNPSREAFEELVDHLLSLPQYGERWGRHWLDVVRFAQSNGYERDGEKPLVWRYRDYVIEAFNDDKPFDRFVMEQLAGDELSDASAESVTATGFYRLGVWDDEPDDKRAAEYDALDDMLATVGQVFLGQTLGCARCHDHMFDPIAQQDYYELLSFLRNVKYYENPTYNLSSATYAPLAEPAKVARFARQQSERIRALQDQRAEATSDDDRKRLDEEIKKVQEDPGPFNEWTLAIREHGKQPKETFLLVRGDAGTPGEKVEPRFLSILGDEAADPIGPPNELSCGLRLQLAKWIASPANPLTARVIANRLWQYHFGRGIARTPNDLGKAGIPPTHPLLLDWLAHELISSGWSLKHLHKQILSSRTWQMSSSSSAKNAAKDPDNNLFWRQNLRRLDAEAIRDSMLLVSGQLNPKMGGRGFFPNLSSEVLAGQSKPGWGWGVSSLDERNRRSVYIFTKRGVRDPLIESFDYVNTTSPLGIRPVTTVAPQALVLTNGRFVQRQALALANRILQDVGDDEHAKIEKLYRLALGRSATSDELKVAKRYLARQESELAKLESVITFRPDVPGSLKTDYRKLLSPAHYVLGPRDTWSYFPGKWVGGYEAVDVLDEQQVPFALWEVSLSQGRIHGRMMLHNATRFGSLLLNGAPSGELFEGLEIRIDPGNDRLVVMQHANELKELNSVEFGVSTSTWYDIELHLRENDVALMIDGQQVLQNAIPEWKEGARFGVCVSRGALSFDDLRVDSSGQTYRVSEYKTTCTPTHVKALQSLCVVVLNTNEFLYLD